MIDSLLWPLTLDRGEGSEDTLAREAPWPLAYTDARAGQGHVDVGVDVRQSMIT